MKSNLCFFLFASAYWALQGCNSVNATENVEGSSSTNLLSSMELQSSSNLQSSTSPLLSSSISASSALNPSSSSENTPLSSTAKLSSFEEASSSSAILAGPNQPIRTSIRNYIFGHSLINHELRINPVPSQETSVPHWMALLAKEAGYEYAVSGQYGFLGQHRNLPPIAQWGFDFAEPAWNHETTPFSEADFNTSLITAANFIQWRTPFEALWGEDEISGPTPVSATIEISDWLQNQEPGIQIYIYENWPDMGGRIAEFPPTSAEWKTYLNYAHGDFHQWWLDYHDGLISARPDLKIKMIPVGPVLLDLIDSDLVNQVPFAEIFEDEAPHGRASCYFLAALICYRAMYGVLPPTSYQIPAIIHPEIRKNYQGILNFIEVALKDFQELEGGRLF